MQTSQHTPHYFHRSRNHFWISACNSKLGSKGSINRENHSIGVMPDYSQVTVDGRSITSASKWGDRQKGSVWRNCVTYVRTYVCMDHEIHSVDSATSVSLHWGYIPTSMHSTLHMHVGTHTMQVQGGIHLEGLPYTITYLHMQHK